MSSKSKGARQPPSTPATKQTGVGSTLGRNGVKDDSGEADQDDQAEDDDEEDDGGEDMAEDLEEQEEELDGEGEDAVATSGKKVPNHAGARGDRSPQGGLKTWRVGERCQARYSADGLWYSATVIAVISDSGKKAKAGDKRGPPTRYRVRYHDYDGEEELASTSLRPAADGGRRDRDAEDDDQEDDTESGKKRKRVKVSSSGAAAPSSYQERPMAHPPPHGSHPGFFPPPPSAYYGAPFPPPASSYGAPPSPWGPPSASHPGLGAMMGDLSSRGESLLLCLFSRFLRC